MNAVDAYAVDHYMTTDEQLVLRDIGRNEYAIGDLVSSIRNLGQLWRPRLAYVNRNGAMIEIPLAR